MSQGKKYSEAKKKIEVGRPYPLKEGLDLLKEIAFSKFDEAVEFVVRLNIEQKHSIRGSLSLPHPVAGESRKVLAFVTGGQVQEALAAGAAYAGFEELIEKIRGGWMDFDVAVAHPDLMKEVTKLGPILGRKGLMPNPKVGTVSTDISGIVSEFQKGRVEYRADKAGIVHMKVGKVSMDAAPVSENIQSIFQELIRRKPTDIKGEYVRSVFISSTMGPGIKLDWQSIR